MSGESYFIIETVVHNFFISYQGLKTQEHSVNLGFYCFGFFYEHFNRESTDIVFSYFKPYDVFE